MNIFFLTIGLYNYSFWYNFSNAETLTQMLNNGICFGCEDLFISPNFDNPIGDITPFIGNEPFVVVNPLVPDSGGSNGEECTAADCCDAGYVKDAWGNCIKKPCSGDPLPNPEIAPQKGPSQTLGGMYGCTRFGGTCQGEDDRNKFHGGTDLKANYGDPIFAMYDGFVYSTGFDKDAGYMVLIQSPVNGETIIQEFFHLQDENRVRLNTDGTLNYVKAGDIIGYLGDSGNLAKAIANHEAESHLHLKIKKHDGNNQWDYKNNFDLVNSKDYLNTSINDNGTANQSNTNCN